jgi:hypothetical protein
MKKYYVYEIINPNTNLPFYIGWTSRSAELRYREHIRETRTKVVNYEKVSVIKELLNIGVIPRFNIMYETFDKDASINKEIELIGKYKRIKDGGILTNISKGGEHHTVSSEVKQKLSDLRKGKTYEELFGETKAADLKKNLSDKSKGSNNNMFGKTHTADARQKMSQKLTGQVSHPISEYQKDKIRESNKNRVWTEEMCKKVSESQKQRYKERPESFKTYERTEEHKKSVGAATKSRAVRYTFKHPDHGEFYGTTGDLAKAYKFSQGTEAYKLVKGEYKSYKGWKLA